MSKAACTTIGELAAREGAGAERSVENCHLHFNGPGAAGFGVKRTAMLLPESAMLLIAPGCCGRHGTITAGKSGFEDRMFYLRMDERDIVTGSYIGRISEAARLTVEKANPRALLLCMTCVDALLGTHLESIGKKLERELSVPVVSCFMDPITRESRRAPMVSVQQAIMRCLRQRDTRGDTVSVLGGFVPVDEGSEFRTLLNNAGIRHMREISACESFDEYLKMAEARLNIVIHPQAEASAKDIRKGTGIPYIMWDQDYSPARTARSYETLGSALGVRFDTAAYQKAAGNALAAFAARHPGISFAIGEAITGNPFELAETLLDAGIGVSCVFRVIVTPADKAVISRLNERHPGIPVFSGVHPSMAGADFSHVRADAAIGLDAGYFLPQAVSICWNMERQPLGFEQLTALLDEIERSLASPRSHRELMHGSYLVV